MIFCGGSFLSLIRSVVVGSLDIFTSRSYGFYGVMNNLLVYLYITAIEDIKPSFNSTFYQIIREEFQFVSNLSLFMNV